MDQGFCKEVRFLANFLEQHRRKPETHAVLQRLTRQIDALVADAKVTHGDAVLAFAALLAAVLVPLLPDDKQRWELIQTLEPLLSAAGVAGGENWDMLSTIQSKPMDPLG